MTLLSSLMKNICDRTCDTFTPTSDGRACSTMFVGTGSPIVSGASFGSFAIPKSFTFSFMMKRYSWVRLIVRGWGAMAGLSASWARDTCCDSERAAPMENAMAIRGTFG
jgi:hypothetical protein